MKSILLKTMKGNWQSDDFGRGKTKLAKGRHRRAIKKRAKNRLFKSLNKSTDLG